MVHFPNIEASWHTIAHRPVISNDGSYQWSSLEGRGICLIHTLATPIKAFSGLGKLVMSTISIATITFAVLTFNAHPKHLLQAGANIIDVTVGTVLLPVAMVANIVRGIAGTIFHPGAMIREADVIEGFTFAAEHNILQGIFVNYDK